VLHPDALPKIRFTTHASRIRFIEWAAKAALTDGSVDLKGLSEARGWVVAAVQAQAVQAQEQIAAALASIEHGEHAVRLLAQLQASLAEGKRRPLPPGRVVRPIGRSTTTPEPDAS
jgi:hypothetical protein